MDRSRSAETLEEGEAIFDFFGQLWAIDAPPPPPRNPRVRATVASFNPFGQLLWIRKDLLKSKITPQDCYPVRRSDRFDKPPVSISFARDVWSAGEGKLTYADALKRSMAEGGCWVWQPERPQPRPQRPPPPNQARYPPQHLGGREQVQHQQGAPCPPPPLPQY